MHSRKWRCISHLHCGIENLQTSKSYTGWRKPSHRYVCSTYDLIIHMSNYQNNSIYNLRPEYIEKADFTSKKREMWRDIKTKAKTCIWLYSTGFILGVLAHIMTTWTEVMHKKEFQTHVQVGKWQQSIKGARRGYFNITESLQFKGNLKFPKLYIWPDKVIGTSQNLQLSLPYQGH